MRFKSAGGQITHIAWVAVGGGGRRRWRLAVEQALSSGHLKEKEQKRLKHTRRPKGARVSDGGGAEPQFG